MSAIRLESCNELASEIASPKFLPPLYPHVGDDETSSLAFLFDLSMYIRLIINTKHTRPVGTKTFDRLRDRVFFSHVEILVVLQLFNRLLN